MENITKINPKHMHLKKENNKNWLMIIIVVFLVIYAISILAPFAWGVITSFKTKDDFRNNFNFGLPLMEGGYVNYINSLKQLKVQVDSIDGSSRYVYFPELFTNSFIYSLGCAIIQNIVSCMVAYLCAKYSHHKVTKLIYGIVIVTMILPICGSLASEIQMAKNLGLFDSFFGIFIMRANFLGMNFMIFYAAFKTIPNDFAEAAQMDGASHFQILIKIMVPLIMPTFFITFLLSFIGYWNDYYIPMIYLPSHPTIAYALYCFQTNSNSAVSFVPAKLAACIIVFVPVFILFLIFRKKLIGNLTVGGLKG
jgi:multiple sugar transport system permease protein